MGGGIVTSKVLSLAFKAYVSWHPPSRPSFCHSFLHSTPPSGAFANLVPSSWNPYPSYSLSSFPHINLHITSSEKPSLTTHLPFLSVPLCSGFAFLYCTYYHLKYHICVFLFFVSPTLLKAPLEAGTLSSSLLYPQNSACLAESRSPGNICWINKPVFYRHSRAQG